MLSVVVFHAFPGWLEGGFVGVDVFFVISGFLITSHIFEKLDRSQFSFFDFFGRRIRRIFPALILVMGCSLAVGWYVLLADEYAQLGKHVASGAVFVTNFVLVDESGYFDNAAETKPMLHLWSLAVEEQFYIVWPLALWLAWKSNISLLTVTLVVAAFSFVIDILFVEKYPTEIFFLPVGRFWELLCGSVLAWLFLYRAESLSKARLSMDRWVSRSFCANGLVADGSTVSNLSSCLGLLLLGFGVVFIDESTPFPSQWTIIPVLGALLVISGGSNAWLNRFFLMNPVAVWFGLISYPLYLWHWPILAFLQILSGEVPSSTMRLLAVAISIFLAWFTYYFVERYFRARPIDTPRILGLVIGMSIVGLLAFLVANGRIDSHSTAQFPDEELLSDVLPTTREMKKACLRRLGISTDSKIRYCRISSETASPTVVLIGDSHSSVAFRGTSYYLEKDYGLTTLNLAGRLFSNVVNAPRGNKIEEQVYLGGFEVADYVASTDSLSTVIMISRGFFYLDWAENFHIPSKPNLTDKQDVYIEGLKGLLDRMREKNVVFVLENPTLDFDPRNCGQQRPINFMSKNCSISREFDDSIHRSYIEKTKRLLSNYQNVVVVDPRDVLCDEGKCYASKGGRVLYRDRNHLNPHGSFIQGKQISEAIRVFFE